MPFRERRVKRSTDKNVRTPFAVFAVGKTCFMEGIPSGVLFTYRKGGENIPAF